MSNVNPSGYNIRPASPQSTHAGYDEASSHPLANLHLNNRSVPHLPSQQYPPEPAPPLPTQFDPTAALDSFQALHISDSSRNLNGTDPIPRAASSMSSHSYQAPFNRAMSYPQTFNPPISNPPGYAEYTPQNGQMNGSVYERDPNTYYDDGSSVYSVPRSPQAYMQPGQGGAGYDQFYNAASNVLGMAPTPPPGPSGVQYTEPNSSFTASNLSLSSSHSAPYPSSASMNSGSTYPASVMSYSNEPEFEGRPSMNRNETSTSVHPQSLKSKAVDLSAPPFTKQYIDQYRLRIKADPDPEAHFLYAKYLIDAARKIRQNTKDPRQSKKYSELLITEALKVVRRLATQGEAYPEAQFYLATCYGTGALGLQVDHERAYHLYLQAAKQNHPSACYRVAVCNEIGAGTRREPPRAAAFYRKSASLGDTAAMYKLGMILLHGSLGEAKNPREAVGWLRRAAEQADEENPHALHELALLHEVPNSGLVPYDPILAKNLFTQAAQLGYPQSQYRLGQCYEYGALNCPVDPRRSIAWYTRAAEKNDAEAELALSGWYLTGSEGVLKQSDSEAYLWARRAANKGLSKAEYAVGYYAEVGIGIKQDVDFAKRWYMRAAAQGNKRAMNRLTEMKRSGNRRTNMARPTRQQAEGECVIS